MTTAIHTIIEPLIRGKIFSTEEDAIRVIVREYILQQIKGFRHTTEHFENKYGMRFEDFDAYLRQRSALLVSSKLSEEQRLTLGRAVMTEEDDWLDWKMNRDMLDRWLGISRELTD